MTEANSPAFALGREHKEARNDALVACPAQDINTYTGWKNGYNAMYDRGWNSIPEASPHSCKTCRPATSGAQNVH